MSLLDEIEVLTPRRKVVFILTDDQRFDALGLLNDYFRTPHLDRLADAGVLFENAFVTTSLCSPSRASILLGQASGVFLGSVVGDGGHRMGGFSSVVAPWRR